MQDKREDLEKLINSCFDNIKIEEDYNEKLIRKLHKKQNPNEKIKNWVPSLSLISAGLFIIIFNISSLQSQVTMFQIHFITELLLLKLNMLLIL